jgi:hypothetical protein
MMRFYNQQHRFYGGVDLHARDEVARFFRLRQYRTPPAEDETKRPLMCAFRRTREIQDKCPLQLVNAYPP